ncbi:MAG: helix-turn-helix domain-containing protein [Pseudomonadota bacterium]
MNTIRKAFKFRLDVDDQQNDTLTAFADACRYVWNKALGMNLSRLKAGDKLLWKEEFQFWLKLWNIVSWANAIHKPFKRPFMR